MATSMTCEDEGGEIKGPETKCRTEKMVFISEEMERWNCLRNSLGLEEKDNPVVAKYLLDLYSNVGSTVTQRNIHSLPDWSPPDSPGLITNSGLEETRKKRIEDIASKIRKRKLNDCQDSLSTVSEPPPAPAPVSPVSSHIVFKELDAHSIIMMSRHPVVSLVNDQQILALDSAMTLSQENSRKWKQFCAANRDGKTCVLPGLYRLWQQNKYLDAVLVVNRHRVALHKILLIGASPVLSGEFGQEPIHDMNEYRLEIDNTDMNNTVLVSLVRYLYTGLLVCSPRQQMALHRLARLLKIDRLCAMCNKVKHAGSADRKSVGRATNKGHNEQDKGDDVCVEKPVSREHGVSLLGNGQAVKDNTVSTEMRTCSGDSVSNGRFG
ncbi:uncharacterized protein LOC124142892 [Haliotis rufescens]|uniref:uncharacterized protein LOC124142892 n=1 Tax=Haliotis rufescens TaxID=6454 RepID=UPI001EB00105|nr:uncharacterized protein LOC124142892 [Haliotis rufescens]